MTQEQRRELAAEIVQELRDNAFDGDKWLGRDVAVVIVEAVLAKEGL